MYMYNLEILPWAAQRSVEYRGLETHFLRDYSVFQVKLRKIMDLGTKVSPHTAQQYCRSCI